jgi:hypothetical protein
MAALFAGCVLETDDQELAVGESEVALVAAADSSCRDIQPDHDGCLLKKLWGQCNASWMIANNWCAKTCGRCSDGPPVQVCPDVQPDRDTCAQKKAWGQCDASWMIAKGWCARTCGRCPRGSVGLVN